MRTWTNLKRIYRRNMNNFEKSLKNGIRDTMWHCFQKGGQKASLDDLEQSCKQLIRMATQKNAGQRGETTAINWDTLDMILLTIAIEATAFVLDDRFEKIKKQMEENIHG